jgi:hypothetical protein
MSRCIRVDLNEGGWYHVMARGNRCEPTSSNGSARAISNTPSRLAIDDEEYLIFAH